MADNQSSAEACPVDHKTREAWLKNAKANPQPASIPSSSNAGCDSTQMDQSLSTPSTKHPTTSKPLPTERVISSIPRTSSDPTPTPSTANNEQETGASKSGHWIYPSEQQFFNAMKRKNFKAQPEDMSSIVPIHNAVNERAWQEILQWEVGRGGESCGGPKLSSFSGDSSKLTPRARWNTIMGYSAPFDRHDWVVERCGTRVEYVIDFYEGRNEGIPGKPLNFYLDVRPKLNTVEGWRMRTMKMFGL